MKQVLISKRRIIISAIAFIVLLFLSFRAYTALYQPLHFSEPLLSGRNYVSYVVKPHVSLHEILSDLENKKIIPDSTTLWWYAILLRKNRLIKSGEYHFKTGTTSLRILEQISAGQVAYYKLTLQEGWTFAQIMAAINRNAYLQHELWGLNNGAIMARLGYPGQYPEGMFYPDTYYFPRDMTDIAFLKRAYALMQKKLTILWAQRKTDIMYQSPYEALIVASLLEKEAASLNERRLIADLLLRRIQKGMRLQIDPTVAYGLGENYSGKLTHEDLKKDSLYNTYLHAGLPPTPIAAPSLLSIQAALQPTPNNFYYFVAKGEGTHQFSENLIQHNQAVNQYRKVMRNYEIQKSLPNH